MESGLIAELAVSARPAPLLYSSECQPLTVQQCLRQIEYTVLALRKCGIAPEDRVVVVLPNGPELAVCFLAITSAATYAPLNPQLSTDEFRFLLQDLGARVLVTEAGFCPAVVTAAEALNVPVLGLLRPSDVHAAGEFALEGQQAGPAVPLTRRVSRDSVALLLHSSGTTAKPKLIPLTHSNLCASAANIARTLTLGDHDVCLNVMPLFHIHGLVGALLSSVAAGAAVFCTSGFDTFRFHAQMRESGATWCTAVPTMYQAILARAERMRLAGTPQFRLLRSSSAHLYAPVWKRLEDTFQCPVLNSYGMTEASHQIASNPQPPAQRKIGTVGLPAGPHAVLLREDGSLAGTGERAEIAIQGETVTRGYLAPPTANADAFCHGWLRTGDEGSFDEDGYLTLVGRLKDIINVGGEKVSPAEVDAVLMEHPAVAQALSFAVPCRSMGERVYAAVVLEAEVSETSLRRFAGERLARFKVPEKILMVESLPKGPTGKPQRRGMAERLGLAGGV